MRNKLLLMTAFSIAMAMLESAVVVYLRELYYQGRELFPLQPIDGHIALTEVLREAATMIMLVTIGWLVGRNRSERFAWFLFAFAVWDIFYYVFLYLLIDWPQSLLTWDVLFLIPVTWVGPVITPVLLACGMIALAVLILHFNRLHGNAHIGKTAWALLITGAVVCIVAFCWDYTAFVLEQPNASLTTLWGSEALWELTAQYEPRSFPWGIYTAGAALIAAGIGQYARQQQNALR